MGRGGRARFLHFAWVTIVVGVVVVILVVAAQFENPNPEDQCEGIGWGCQLYGTDLARFVAIFLVPPALLVLVVGHVIIAAFNRRTRPAIRVDPER